MEREYILVEQAQSAPLRTMPLFRKARRPRRPVFRVHLDYREEAFEPIEMDSYMNRNDNAKNEYGDYSDFEGSFSVDDILAEYHSGTLFSDFDYSDSSSFDFGDNDFEDFGRSYSEPLRWAEPKAEAVSFDRYVGADYAATKAPSYSDMDSGMDDDELEDSFDYYTDAQADNTPRMRASYEDDMDFEQDRAKAKKPKFSFGKKNKEKKKSKSGYQPKYIAEEEYEDEEDIFAEDFRDVTAGHDAYAAADDYEDDSFVDGYEDDLDIEDAAENEDGYFPPSFSEYLASIFASVFYRLKGTARSDSAATMQDDDEDLGPEVSPMTASKYYGSHVYSSRRRLQIAALLLVLMSYISLGGPVPGMLGYLPVTAAACLAIQLTIMLLALDIVTNGILKLAHLRIGADSLAVIACVITCVDAAMVALGDGTHLPLCALSSLSLVGIMFSSLLSARALRKSMRVPAIAQRTYSIVGENNIKGKDITLLKTSRPATGFVRRSEEAAPDETMFIKISPFILLTAMVLSLVICAVTHDYFDFVYILSAVMAPAVPFAALICFALPFFIGSMKIFSSGAAIAGWSGLCDVGQSSNLIVTDRDLFPEDSISIESIRIFADEDAQKVISYAGTMIIASGCSMAGAFSDEMEENGCTVLPMQNFEYLSGGGMKGIIEGHVVLCGSSDLMRLMNVRIPFRLVDKTTVLLAIDGILYGIFSMNYEAQPQVRKALVDLMRSNRHPIFALRDFNITPEMLKNTFDIATDGYDFPPYVERFKITETEPSENSKIAAVVCREGLASVTKMADTGRNMYTTTKLNLTITLIGAILGMITVFVKVLTTGAISLSFIFTYMLLAALPVFISSLLIKF